MAGRKWAVAATLILVLPLPPFVQAQHDHSKGHQPPAQTKPNKPAKPTLKPAEGASIKILAPTKGQVLKGDKVRSSISSSRASAAITLMPMSMAN